MDQNRLTGLVIGGFIILLVPIWTRTVFGVETNVLTALATVREVKEALDEKRRILTRIDAEKDPAASDKARKHMTVAQEIHELAVTFSTLCSQRYPEYKAYFETSRGRIEIDYASIQKRFQEITGSAAPGAAAAVVAGAPARPSDSLIRYDEARGPVATYPDATAESTAQPPSLFRPLASEPPPAPAVVVTEAGAIEGPAPVEPPAGAAGMTEPAAQRTEQRLGSIAVNTGRGGIGAVPAAPATVPAVPAPAAPVASNGEPVLHAPALAKKGAPATVPAAAAPVTPPPPADPVTSITAQAPEGGQEWTPPGRRLAAAAAPVTEVTKPPPPPAPKKDKGKLHRPTLALAESEGQASTTVTEVTPVAPVAPVPPPVRKSTHAAVAAAPEPAPARERVPASGPTRPLDPRAGAGERYAKRAFAKGEDRGHPDRDPAETFETEGEPGPGPASTEREPERAADRGREMARVEGPGRAYPERRPVNEIPQDETPVTDSVPAREPAREPMRAIPPEATDTTAAAAIPIDAPVGAMMDLPWNRYSSWGLSVAELVFEEPVAAGRSQVLAVFPAQDGRLRKVGPLAPERPASMEFARIIGAVSVHADGEGQAVVAGAVERARRTRDPRVLEPGFFRMKQGPLAGRIFSSLPMLSGAGLSVTDPVGVLSVSFTDRPHVMRNADILIPWVEQEVPLFRYDGRAGRYHRVHGDEVVIDPLDGSPVIADNVVLLGRTTPQGVRCIVYTRGRISPCLLQPRKDLLISPDNQPIALKPGTTWFLCPSGHVGIHAAPAAAPTAASEPRAPKLYGPGGGRGS